LPAKDPVLGGIRLRTTSPPDSAALHPGYFFGSGSSGLWVQQHEKARQINTKPGWFQDQ
jgi:hypothetical protein